jgi:hypothetical protein
MAGALRLDGTVEVCAEVDERFEAVISGAGYGDLEANIAMAMC